MHLAADPGRHARGRRAAPAASDTVLLERRMTAIESMLARIESRLR